ncbi:Uncharacterised protein [uncultured archaeon]|nr:Uncharacterised protein [uncultured archaeon]
MLEIRLKPGKTFPSDFDIEKPSRSARVFAMSMLLAGVGSVSPFLIVGPEKINGMYDSSGLRPPCSPSNSWSGVGNAAGSSK